MMPFYAELAHVTPATDTDGATLQVLPWAEAKAAFITVMTTVNGWPMRAWASKNLTGTINEQVDQYAALSLNDECACWVRVQSGVPTLVRIIKRLSIPEVHVIFGTATSIDYHNVTDHRALWDIGVRRIIAYCDSGWESYYTNTQLRGYISDLAQPENNAPGVVRMTRWMTERP